MASAAGKKNPITSGRATAYELPPSYWVTPPGRNIVSASAAIASGIYFGGVVVFNTFLLKKYRDIVHLYKHGFKTPLTPSVLIRCRDAFRDINMKSKGQTSIEFFCVTGFDVFHAGSAKLRGGAIIGIPRNFTYASEEEIEKHDIMVENKNVEWGSDGGQLLKDSLIMSENAQKFAVARELMMIDTYYPYSFGLVGPTAIFTYYGITRTINDRFNGLARPKSFRMLVYTLVGTFAFGLWATLQDSITKYYEKSVDDSAGNLGLNYARGGVEFYSKLLERNMALRSLMGPNGEKLYTFYGNDVEMIRQKHVPFTERKRNLEIIAGRLAQNSANLESGGSDPRETFTSD